jgi:hypothetical protein
MAVNRKEHEIIHSVVVLTQDDKLRWEYDAQGFYFATLEDMELKFQACCTPKAPSFFINGIRFYLGDNAVMELCNEIAIQAQRHCRNIEKLDELNERLKIIAFPKKETA